MKLITAIFGLFLLFSYSEGQSSDITATLNNVFNGYDKRVRPNAGGQPLQVGVTAYVLSVPRICESKMEFTMDFYFRQIWKDPRLTYSGRTSPIHLYDESVNKFWVPDTFFVNAKSIEMQKYPEPNGFIRLDSSGNIRFSRRYTVTASCPMNLQYYPFDTQRCTLEIESYAFSMTDIRYKFHEGKKTSVGISSDVSLPEFRILGHSLHEMEVSLSTGNYSRIAIDLVFSRSYGYYLIQIFIPSIFFLILCWVPMWLEKKHEIRVAVCLITIVCLSFLAAAVSYKLPKISYTKAIDVWTGMCLTFAFATFIVELFLERFGTEEEEVSPDAVHGRKDKILRFFKKEGLRSLITGTVIPFLFLIFNIWYWATYLTLSKFHPGSDFNETF